MSSKVKIEKILNNLVDDIYKNESALRRGLRVNRIEENEFLFTLTDEVCDVN